MGSYPADYYQRRDEVTRPAAQLVLGRLFELAPFASVVDVGCGVGSWLAVCLEMGVQEVFGIDAPWLDPSFLIIPQSSFLAADLNDSLDVGRRFDLAISLEVAEHVDPRHAREFVRTLTELAPVVLFSAAVPGQGGLDHVNEQWPDYWRDLFAEFDFQVIDCIRQHLWQAAEQESVPWWYAQNSFLFVQQDYCSSHPSFAVAREATNESMLSLVHPRLLENKCHKLANQKASRGSRHRRPKRK